jgi:Ice-binding-like
MDPGTRPLFNQMLGGAMHILPRLTARLAVVASFAALLAAACNTDSKNLTAPSARTLSADREGRDGSSSPGSSSSFAVLANQAVTCTGGTITGDVGTFQALPTGSFTNTGCTVTGTVHVGDGAAKGAYSAFLSAYTADATTPCGTVETGTLAGVTLQPGVYCFDAAATLTGTLTLNGAGAYLFKIGTGGTGALTGTNFTVALTNGASACNVTWWVAQAATMTDSHFDGSILAGAAITLTRGTFNGNAWAGASGVGDVTITGTAVVGCAASGKGHHHRKGHHEEGSECNQGVGNGPEGCDPGNSDHHNGSNDENGGTPGDPGRQGGDDGR